MSIPLATNGSSPFSAIAEVHQVSPNAVDELLEHLPVAVMLVDRDGRMVYANGAARSLDVERLEPLQWAITRALLTEDVVREDEIEVAVLGKPRTWLSAYVTPIHVAGLGANAAFVVLSDVTARTRIAAWTPVIETLVNL